MTEERKHQLKDIGIGVIGTLLISLIVWGSIVRDEQKKRMAEKSKQPLVEQKMIYWTARTSYLEGELGLFEQAKDDRQWESVRQMYLKHDDRRLVQEEYKEAQKELQAVTKEWTQHEGVK